MLKIAKRYLWPKADVAERISTVLTALTAAIGIGLAILDWTDRLDIKSHFTVSFLVFAAGVVLVGFLVEAERRRSTAVELDDLKKSLEKARSTFAEAHDTLAARQIPGSSVSETLDGILASSAIWLFRGGSARYQRGDVLPKLAKVTATDVPYQIQILDPRDANLCAAYADYRRQARPADRKLATEDASAIKNEILATLYAVGWYRHQSRIRPVVALVNSYSPIRIDIGTTGAVMTVASHIEPGLLAPAGSFLYAAIKDEIEQATNVLPRVDLPTDANLYPSDESAVTAPIVEAALTRMTVISAAGGAPQPLLVGVQGLDFAAIAGRVFVVSPY